MPKGGSKPGERRGGREAGVPNRVQRAEKIVLEELAREYAVECLDVLAKLMRDPTQPGATRATCSTALLDRGYGKPRQSVDMNASVKTSVQTLTDEELNAKISALNEP